VIALPVALQGAQQETSRRPYVECYIDDRPVEMPRLEWTEIYSEGEEGWSNAAVVAFDGAIVRARSALVGGVYQLQVQRITDPEVMGQWTAWSVLVGSMSPWYGRMALQADDASPTVRVFYVDATQKVLYCRVSGDNGATWGTDQVVYDMTGTGFIVRAVAADGRHSDTRVVWVFDPGGVDPDDYLCVSEWNPSYGWLTVADVDQRYASVHSLGVGHGDDNTLYILVASTVAGTLALGLRKYVIGAGFQGNFDMLTPGDGSGYAYRCPYVRVPQGSEQRFMYVYAEYVGGVINGYRLVMTPASDWLANEVPLDIQALRGAVLLKRSGYWYLVCSYRALRARAYEAAVDRVDVSGDVKALEIEETAMHAGRMVVVLDNADGAYKDAGVSGTYKCVREGSRVAVKLGYETAEGNLAVWASPWWIEGVFFEDDKGEGNLRLECIDAWGWLERLKAPRQVTFTNQTLNYILLRVLWSVCGIADGLLHSNLDVTVPTFTWIPGESLASVARRILEMAGLWLRFKTVQTSDGASWDSVGVEVVQLGSGASSYSYGPTAHPVSCGQYGIRGLRPNDFAVEGLTHVGYQVDYDGIRDVGRRLFQREVDRHLDTQAKVDALADYLEYAARVGTQRGFLEAGANVGQQVGDVVDITDARANLAGALRRVGGVRIDLDRKRGRFKQRVELVRV